MLLPHFYIFDYHFQYEIADDFDIPLRRVQKCSLVRIKVQQQWLGNHLKSVTLLINLICEATQRSFAMLYVIHCSERTSRPTHNPVGRLRGTKTVAVTYR